MQVTSWERTMKPFIPPRTFPKPSTGSAYDFERPSYLPLPPRRPASDVHSSSQQRQTTPRAPSGGSSAQEDVHDEDAGDLELGFADNDSASGAGGSGSGGRVVGGEATASTSRLDRARLALGRFGRFVGMGIPGATYASLSQEDGSRSSHGGQGRRRPRVVGGGVGQDGVFANLNAKPERRRRTGAADGDPDRGDDDDLAEEALPPTYEVAAADATPPYWETTILGTPGLHPLIGGMGWTPGSAHVGALEDLIVEGLPVGNFFGFAWNLLVSMTFQFVGFLLTYLLHTTHAAKCGSRAGLGITMIQYGFYLRTRASQIAEGKLDEDDGGMASGASNWFGEPIDFGPTQTLDSSQGGARRRSDGSLADAFAAQGDAPVDNANLQQSMSASTEWLSYVLMVVGWFLLLSSLLSYWRIHRWGQSLVNAARRDQENSRTAGESGNGEGEGDGEGNQAPPIGFVHRLRAALSSGNNNGREGHSAEDWIIFPGIGHRLGNTPGSGEGNGRNGRESSLRDLEDEDGLHTADARLNPDERRLLEDMRNLTSTQPPHLRTA
ncbi:hypothetical protein IE53DRAFT_176951 [Violaceomyces palustris]|uniref:Uncharacterized protein n=1 Tax=Violaceomyces palustris TaxID=1673888 RepID=A0ACD0P5M7_9BASI|nr:hypothetical protein IE53DRAFT_176951 [Violaceomyces palustris]